MRRRSFLQASAVLGATVTAGCLTDGSGDQSNENTVLAPPEREQDVDPEALIYPAYGQEVPDVALPSPLHDREVSTREFVGSRETLITFVFTRCQGPCPGLTAALAAVQADAAEAGYADEVALMPITFDPEYDTAERIREFSEENGADPTAENWQFLRPPTPERAQEALSTRETFGIGFEKVPAEESSHSGHSGDGSGQEMSFIHLVLLLLVNRDGYVERAYTPQPPRPDIVLEDLETVREGYS